MVGRLAVRIVKLAALLLATVGLALVWWGARGVPIPEIEIAQAGATMNLAYVRLRGYLSRGLTYDRDGGYLGFWLNDGTGEVHVNAYDDVVEALVSGGRAPAIGDELNVAGTLRVREDYLSLTVDVPEHCESRRPEAIPVKAGQITILDEGLRVRLNGQVGRIRVPYEGLRLIDVGDDTGEITVAIDRVVEALTGSLPKIRVGHMITVTGVVNLYRTTPQIVPASVDDLTVGPGEPIELGEEALVAGDPMSSTLHPTAEPSIPLTELGALSAADLGRAVQIQGAVVMFEGMPGGVKATVDDGTSEIVLLLWNDVYDGLVAPQTLDIGAQVTVTGRVQVYEGMLEIIPEDPAGVTIGTPADPAPWVQLGNLVGSDAGRVVRARGVLQEPEGFSAGVKVVLKDGTGDITVLFWQDLYQTLAPRPQAGQQVEVTGLVNLYRDELELIPRTRHDWFVRPMED